MSMQSKLDKKQWDTFWKVWDRKLETLPGAKKAALYAAGKAVLPALRQQIERRVDDRDGRVRKWQEIRLGSKGGYVAISPVDDQISINQTADRYVTSRDITQYLERGHKIRPPSGRAKRYNPRVKSGRTYVPGRMFYSWTRLDATKLAVSAAREQILEWINELAEVDV